ncbi:EAL domain-containing protein [Clostridiales bacterium COT073_COT-073]|nr:EAL domain-containing protein [Clostridiales bacterium COT073_COT-073]
MSLMWEQTEDGFGENSVNESLKRMMSISDPDEAIDDLLLFLGEKCFCERTYIFEKTDHGTFSNTYEWCAEGIIPQKDLLQEEPLETIQWWWDLFENDRPVIIRDLEDIKDVYPQLYAGLKPQEITTLVTAPISLNGNLVGFLGVDNPEVNQVDSIARLLSGIGYFVAFVIERRNLNRRLEYSSYHDQLTGAKNRHAYSEFIEKFHWDKSMGVVFCDVSELKQTNDTMGHIQGDKLITFWYENLKTVFSSDIIYRIGGDEFVVFCENWLKKDFYKAISALQKIVYNNVSHLAVGSAWGDLEQNIQELINQAERGMYLDKANYYNQQNPFTGEKRDRRQNRRATLNLSGSGDKESEFAKFLQSNHFDPVVFFKSVSMSDYYLYIGDMQSGLFYISDEMKDHFGFQSNIVSNLLEAWQKRIDDQEEVAIYKMDMDMLMRGEKDVHDLRYRIKDKNGNDVWVHSHGRAKWNDDRSELLFIAGGVSRQEQNFIVDAVTNFPKEYAAMLKIREMQDKNNTLTIIGFTLNNFSEINELRGRHAADIFLRKISKKLTQNFDSKIVFYRLDGMRFIGIVLPDCAEEPEKLIKEIKEVIARVYYGNNIMVQVPCSVGIIYDAGEESLPQDILVNMVTLLAQAKQAPEKEYMVHSRQDSYSQRTRAQLTMELSKDVLNGFKNFRVVVQPVVSTEKGEIASGEVLLRWNFEGKDISPTVFIPMLEKSRLILPVGRWVLEQAIRTCHRTNAFLANFRLAVNISYYQILDATFLPFIKEMLQKYNLSGNQLILEITETHYDETPLKVREFVENCRKMGIEVAIDDFGDGYSSLAFLIKYPATIVKLDRSLINEMVSSQENINFISSIVYACHKFGKKVCAEGVENREEFEILKDSGCDLIQGYYFYKPLELKDFYSLLIGDTM